MNESTIDQGSPESLRDLAEAFDLFNRQAEHLRESQGRLEAEVARLQEELAQKNEQLARRERLALLGEMAAGVAHEIRNPLGGIRLYVDLLAKHVGGEGQEIVEKVLGGIGHLDRIVEDLLLYTRDLTVERSGCRLEAVVEEALRYARPDLEAASIRIEEDRPDHSLLLEADASLLCRVVLNLVRNAAAAMEGGGGGRLGVRLEPFGDGGARISIEDDGVGIEPCDLDRIFHPFFTRRLRSGGTGLGLSICHRIVEAHRGSISVESEPGRGSVFTVTLPPAHPQGRVDG